MREMLGGRCRNNRLVVMKSSFLSTAVCPTRSSAPAPRGVGLDEQSGLSNMSGLAENDIRTGGSGVAPTDTFAKQHPRPPHVRNTSWPRHPRRSFDECPQRLLSVLKASRSLDLLIDETRLPRQNNAKDCLKAWLVTLKQPLLE